MLGNLKFYKKMMNVTDLEKYQSMRENKVMLEQLNDKGMEGIKSNGLATTRVLEATNVKCVG
jgi:hypothetical protein